MLSFIFFPLKTNNSDTVGAIVSSRKVVKDNQLLLNLSSSSYCFSQCDLVELLENPTISQSNTANAAFMKPSALAVANPKYTSAMIPATV